MREFTRREIEQSFRMFNDLAGDLAEAGQAAWHARLKLLIHHCREDPVMCVVVAPLRERHIVDLDEWLQGAMQRRCYDLPVDNDERLAMFYQLLERINNDKFDLVSLSCEVLCAGDYIDDTFFRFNEHFVSKFARDVGYRLQDVLEQTANHEFVSSDFLNIFGAGAPSIYIGGDMVGSAIGPGAAIVESSVSTFEGILSTIDDESRAAILEARTAIEAEHLPREETRDALDALTRLAEELTNAKPAPTRIRRYWGVLQEVVPAIAKALSSLRAIADLITKHA